MNRMDIGSQRSVISKFITIKKPKFKGFEYQTIHQRHQITRSMTDGYDCYQNALAERVNGILKNEFLLNKPKDLEEARKMVKQSIKIYNELRPHQSLKYKTPDEVHQAFLNQPKIGE